MKEKICRGNTNLPYTTKTIEIIVIKKKKYSATQYKLYFVINDQEICWQIPMMQRKGSLIPIRINRRASMTYL